MRILLLEDDPLLSQIMEEFLVQSGHDVYVCMDGSRAEEVITAEGFDMLLLDIQVPGISGLELMRRLDAYRVRIPTIFITSIQGARELKEAFDLGADDYIKKPFDLEELEVRIARTARQFGLGGDAEIRLGGGMSFHPSKQTVESGTGSVQLKKKEAAVLHYLYNNRSRTVSSDELVNNIWRFDEPPTDATIRTYIKNLRHILGNDRIVTVKGVGYRLDTV